MLALNKGEKELLLIIPATEFIRGDYVRVYNSGKVNKSMLVTRNGTCDSWGEGVRGFPSLEMLYSSITFRTRGGAILIAIGGFIISGVRVKLISITITNFLI